MEVTVTFMKLTSHRSMQLAIALAIATPSLALLRTVAYYLDFDATVGYFDSALLSTLLYIIPLLLCIAGMALAYLRSPSLPKEKKSKKTPEQKSADKQAMKTEKDRLAALKRAGVPLPPESMPYLEPPLDRSRTRLQLVTDILCVAAYFVAALLDFFYAAESNNMWYLARTALALFSIFAFLFPTNGHRLSGLSRTAYLMPIAWCVFGVAMDYFDWNTPMNGPTKIYTQLALCFVALYLSAQARLTIADLVIRRRNVFAVPAVIFGFSGGVAGLLTYPAGLMPRTALAPILICTALSLHAAVAIYPIFHGDVARLVTPPPAKLPDLPKNSPDSPAAPTTPERQDP